MPFLLLTGASSFIAQAIVNHPTLASWDIIVTDKAIEPDISGRLLVAPAKYWIKADLRDMVRNQDSLKQFEEEVRTILNGVKLNSIIHNAAIQKVDSFACLTIEDWLETMEVNLLAPVAINKLFLSDLESVNGTIIHVSSIHSHLTKPGFTAYATSKAALSGLTRAMAVELGDRVRVNAIEPAAIRTPMLEAGFTNHPELLSLIEKHHPTKSIGSPEDVARAVSFLLDPANNFLNGCVLELGGGIHSRLHDPA